MSWIADIAGRAENILNNIDKNAANVIQQTAIRLGEEWPTTKTYNNDNKTNKNPNVPNISLSGLSKFNNTSTTLTKVLVTNAKDNSEADSSTVNLSLNCTTEEGNEIHFDESRQTTNHTNENFCDSISGNEEKIVSIESSSCDLMGGIYGLKEDLKKNQSEEKVQQLEKIIKDITMDRDNLSNKMEEMCAKNNMCINTISELEMNLKKSQQKYIEINEKLGWQTKETEQIRSELDKYRKKAQSTLQIKDKMIEHLKNNSVENKLNNSNSITYNDNANILEFEINSLKEENSIKTNELQEKTNKLESQETLIKVLNQKIVDINSKSHETIISWTNRFKLEQEKSIQLELQMKAINQESLAMRQEFNRQSQSFSRKLHQKEKEILLLQTPKTIEITELNSTEGKIKSLTQVLFEKQAAIETLTVEKSALKLHLEKVQEQLHYAISVNRPQRTQIVNVNDTDDVKSQLPLIMKETPFDTQVARRVKRAYTSFDSAGIRIGVFLRRYPLVRIMVFVYVALLHIWVMFVLLSSTPT